MQCTCGIKFSFSKAMKEQLAELDKTLETLEKMERKGGDPGDRKMDRRGGRQHQHHHHHHQQQEPSWSSSQKQQRRQQHQGAASGSTPHLPTSHEDKQEAKTKSMDES